MSINQSLLFIFISFSLSNAALHVSQLSPFCLSKDQPTMMHASCGNGDVCGLVELEWMWERHPSCWIVFVFNFLRMRCLVTEKMKEKNILLLTVQVKVSEGLYAWWLYKGTHWILQLFRANEQLLALTKSLIWFDVDWSGYIVIVIVRELICNTWQNFTGRI